MNPSTHNLNRKSGQALAEMIVGLVGIMVLFAVILQIGQLSRAHRESLSNARSGAGDDAMNPTFQTPIPGPRYIRTWEAGGDLSRYSQDDTILSGAGTVYDDNLAPVVPITSLDQQISDTPFSIDHTETARSALFLVADEDDSEQVDILPVLQNLIYDADSISIESKVWMTWLKGLQ